MIELTLEQRQTMSRENEVPPRALDPDTKTAYVLIRQEVFDRIRSLFLGEEESQLVHEMYPHVMEVFGRTGWDDPAMDIYNDLDPRRTS